jgi:hypothetical protein
MKNNPDPLDPLQKWWSCWGTAITGVPSPVTTTICSVESRLDELMTAIDEFERKMMALTSITRELQEFKDKVNNEVRALGKEAFLKILEKVTDVNIKKIMDAFVLPASDARLNMIFGTDRSSNRQKGLLEFADMSSLVKWEMNLAGSGGQYFDAQKYNVIYNAVLLAKLSLLDKAGLQLLAEKAGVAQSVTYGGELFGAAPESNLLLGAIRNIDGNHQWMEIAPAYPRRDDNFYDREWPFERQFGYSAMNGLGQGFRLWADCNARNALFRPLFHGPLNPGIEIPEIAGFPEVLTPLYREFMYDASLENPFPAINHLIPDGCPIETYLPTLPTDPTIPGDPIDPPDGSVPSIADIAILGLELPVTVATPGIPFTVAGALVNQGTASTDTAVSVGFYLSSDPVYGPDDLRVGIYETQTPLNVGEVLGFVHNINFPVVGATIQGNFYLLAVADPLNLIPELDDSIGFNGNNLAVGGLITISSP